MLDYLEEGTREHTITAFWEYLLLLETCHKILQKDETVHVYGNTAVVTSTADVKGTNKGADISGTYQASRVWVKRNGKWQQVLFQSTKVSEQK